jgi:nicotinate-nucleotide adenylyltransferase
VDQARSANNPRQTLLQKLGLFGGTFDPVHNGHLRIALCSKKQLNLNSVIFLPARVPPHKKGKVITSPHHRLAMLKLVLHGYPGFQISRYDLNRRAPAYTIDTLRYFKRTYPRALFFFMMGSDSLRDFPGWKDPQEILQLCRLAVVPRPGFSAPRIAQSLRDQIHWINSNGVNVSSTFLRRRLKEGKNVRRFIPVPVVNYIQRHSLYGVGT